ncbi:NAD(P) transhydrogenase subunit alpha [Erysipelotrichaceae bacterium OttesenSCG-928-M19]|nr:NAD(P) transhydrogenase subunit alpha [Erysipelotrichaceae bacterium OttesenSCG-928-M19]
MKYSNSLFGVPKEIMENENRVALDPSAVKKLVDEGATVWVETNAGMGSMFRDEEYAEAGAVIKENVKDIFDNADVILKVKEPQFNKQLNEHEVNLLREGQTIITFLHPATPSNHDTVRTLAERGVTSITLDGIPRITRAQKLDALTSMSTVAGYKGMIMAVNHLTKFVPMIGTAVGVIKPANVLVIGSGVSGLQAIATAKRLGATTTVVDIRPDALEQGSSLGAKSFDVGVPAELSVGEGGYAQQLPEEWLEKEREKLKEIVADQDIVFLTALVPGKVAPKLITKEMVDSLKDGSVVVDVSIDQGGNCELTKPGEVYVYNNKTIIGTKNIPGHMPQSSTWMFAQNMVAVLDLLYVDGKINLDLSDVIIESSLVTKDKQIMHKGALEAMEKAN